MILFRGIHPRMSNTCVTILLPKESISSVVHLVTLKGKKPPASTVECYWTEGLDYLSGLVWTRVQHWGTPCLSSTQSSPTPGRVQRTLIHTDQSAVIHGVAVTPTHPTVFVCSDILECRPTGDGNALPKNLHAITEMGALGKSLTMEEPLPLRGICLKQKQRGGGFAAAAFPPSGSLTWLLRSQLGNGSTLPTCQNNTCRERQVMLCTLESAKLKSILIPIDSQDPEHIARGCGPPALFAFSSR